MDNETLKDKWIAVHVALQDAINASIEYGDHAEDRQSPTPAWFSALCKDPKLMQLLQDGLRKPLELIKD
jgi:hypothetical protein